MDDTHIPEQEALLRIPIATENIREELHFYRILKDHFKTYGKPTEDLDFIIKNLEDQLLKFEEGNPILPDQKMIQEAIEKHPYFKNPCDYPIRLLTILKYLKRKGINMNYADIDVYVDNLIQKMDGVRKVGRGLYIIME